MNHRHSLPAKWNIMVRFASQLGLVSTAVTLLSSTLFAQAGNPSGASKMQEAPAPLSHDLSGVWMQYPEGDVPGTPGMNTVNQRFRPPLTPWGQARLDAA